MKSSGFPALEIEGSIHRAEDISWDFPSNDRSCSLEMIPDLENSTCLVLGDGTSGLLERSVFRCIRETAKVCLELYK